MKSNIVKRRGKRPSEQFNDKKLHSSVYAACLSVRTPEGEADRIANDVLCAVLGWCSERPEITSHDIRRVAARQLSQFHPDAAYLYQHHGLVL